LDNIKKKLSITNFSKTPLTLKLVELVIPHIKPVDRERQLGIKKGPINVGPFFSY